MRHPSKVKIAGSIPAEGTSKYGGYSVVVTLFPVEKPSPVQIRLAAQKNRYNKTSRSAGFVMS